MQFTHTRYDGLKYKNRKYLNIMHKNRGKRFLCILSKNSLRQNSKNQDNYIPLYSHCPRVHGM